MSGWLRRGFGDYLRCREAVWTLPVLLAGASGHVFAQGPISAAVVGRLLDQRGLPVRGAEVRCVSGRERGCAGSGYGWTWAVWDAGDGAGSVCVLGADVFGAGFGLGAARVEVEPGGVEDGAFRVRADPGGLRLDWRSVDGGDGLEFEGASDTQVSRARPGAPGVVARQGEAGTVGELPVPGRQWEAVGELNSAAQDATLAGNGREQGEEADSAAGRAEQEVGSPASGLSFEGLPVVENAQAVDGLSADQAFRGGPRGAASGGPRMGSGFGQSAVGALRVMPRTFSAQYGGAGGGLAVGSRAVGARLRGSVFFQARESGWAATNPFAVVSRFENGAAAQYLARPGESFLQYGGAAGVPLRMPGRAGWRMGLFGSVEVRRRAQTLFSSPQTASFFALTPMQQALLANRGVGTAAVSAALSYLSGLTGTADVVGTQALSFARLDVSPGERDRLSVGYQRQRLASPMTGGGQFAEGVVNRAVSSIGWSVVHADAGTARWLHLFGPRVTNEVRAQMARDLEYEAIGAPPADVPAIGPGGLAPEVAIEPQGFVYGTPAALGRVAYPDETRVEVADTFAWRFGRHLLTLGGDWSRVDDRVLSAANLDGTFLYDSGTTNGRAGGLVDWITDYTYGVNAYPNGACPSINASVHYFCFRSYSQSFSGSGTEFVTHDVAGFAEDVIRAASNLRVTLGARWDYLLLPFPQAPNTTLDRALATAGVGAGSSFGGSTASFPEDRNNVGPRVSVAWSPGGEGRHGRWFTARAGYGMFFGRLPGAMIQAALLNTGLPSAMTSVRITPTVETACPQVPNQGFGFPCAFLSAPGGVVATTGSAMVFGRGFRLPAVQRGSFEVERAIGRAVAVRVGYATAWATQLAESVDLNIAPSTGMVSYVLQGGDGRKGLWSGQTFTLPLYVARRTALFGPVTKMESNANATYHSGNVEARLREWHGWGARGSYTFSRAIDYGPQMGATPRLNGQFDPFSDGYDKGLSSLNGTHRFAGDLLYRSEWRTGPRVVRAVVSGWRLAAIGTAGSGAPYSYVVFGGTRLNGGHESMNGSGGATFLPTLGRNTLRLPRRGKMDLRVARGFGLGGERRLEVRGDVFNVLNSVNLTRVETRAFLLGTPASAGAPTPLIFQDAAAVAAEGVSTPAFGTPLSSTSGLSRERTVELGVRLSF